MTKKEYRKLSKSDKQVIKDASDIVTKFMTDRTENRTKYKINLLSMIERFIYNKSDSNAYLKEFGSFKNAYGICNYTPIYSNIKKIVYKKLNIYPKNLKFRICIGINNAYDKQYFETLETTVHEMNHVDTHLYSYIDNNTRYSGTTVFKIIGNDIERRLGIGLNESLNELYSQLQLFNTFSFKYKNIHNIDNLVYSFKLPEYDFGRLYAGESYRKLTLITRLLLIASDNDLDTSYESLKGDGKKFIEKTVDLNGTKVYKNDLLYAGKKNFKEYGQKFDELCNDNEAMLKLLNIFDYMLKCFDLNLMPEKQAIFDAIELIDQYKNAKYDLLVKNGLWSKTKRANAEYQYNRYKSYVYSWCKLNKIAKVTEIPQEEKTLRHVKTGN